MNKKTTSLVDQLDQVISDFVAEVLGKKLRNNAAGDWSVKDVLGHIVFWHEYYADQYKSLADKKNPFVWKSLAGVNEIGKQKMERISRKDLIHRLKEAQLSLRDSILKKRVLKMRYMASREYRTDDFLEVIIGHIQGHTLQVRRSKKR